MLPPSTMACFNEAAAIRGGILALVGKELEDLRHASMRPPRFAAEYAQLGMLGRPAEDASMRPPRFAAEYQLFRQRRQLRRDRFNEAAAIRGGIPAYGEIDQALFEASMRPPRFAAEYEGAAVAHIAEFLRLQ